jgi:long-chain acyl-CoA synthetase
MGKDIYSQLKLTSDKYKEKIAFIDGENRYSYQQLINNVDKAANMFWQLGIRKGDSVAISLKNSIEFIISYFALSKLGAITVPINFMISKKDELLFILGNSKAKGIITEADFLKNYEGLTKELEDIKFILSTNSQSEKAHNFWTYLKHSHHHEQASKNWSDPKDVVSILYTSGTTGNPKGVLLTNENLLSNAKAAIEVIHPYKDEVFMALLPMFHTLCWTANVIVPIILGSKTLIVKNITPPKPWLTAMGREGVSIMIAVPQIYNVLANQAKGFKKIFLKYWAFRRVWLAVSGAAPLNKTVAHQFEKVFKIKICEGYGLTETSPIVSLTHPKKIKHGSVGRAIPGVEIKIVSEENKPLKPGEVGEICVKGPNVTRGYHKNDDATRELFTNDGWLKTGDIGLLDDEGFLFIQDRKKDMVIVKGLKVFPVQIEQVIATHPRVQECTVIGIPDSKGDESMKCFCVAKEGEELDKMEIMNYIRKNLDPYKRPKEVEIVNSLPKNTLQKVLKRELLRMELEKRMNSGKKVLV